MITIIWNFLFTREGEYIHNSALAGVLDFLVQMLLILTIVGAIK